MKKLIAILSLLGMFHFAQAEAKISILTENYPPYNMSTEDGLAGISVDVLAEILKKVDSSLKIEDVTMTNWSRAYSQAQKREGHMVFSTTKTKSRENLFKWVGPIATTTIGVIAPKDKGIKIESKEDLKKYKIGTVFQDIGENLLKEMGLDEKNIFPVSGKNAIEISFRKLQNGRIDMFAYDFSVAKYSARLEGFDTDDYEVVYILNEGELYYAFNKNVDDSLIEKWQKALEEIKENGKYQEIVNKYL